MSLFAIGRIDGGFGVFSNAIDYLEKGIFFQSTRFGVGLVRDDVLCVVVNFLQGCDEIK